MQNTFFILYITLNNSKFVKNNVPFFFTSKFTSSIQNIFYLWYDIYIIFVFVLSF